MKRNNVKNASSSKNRLKTFMTITSLSALTLNSPLTANATTIDDLRELLGSQRVDSLYTPEQQGKIILDYTLIENNNKVAKMLNASNPLDINKTIRNKSDMLNKRIESERLRLLSGFSTGDGVTAVLSAKTSLGTLIHERDGLARERPILKMKVMKNPHKKTYFDIIGNLKEIKNYKKIGIVGNNLLSPLETGFVTVSAFGYMEDRRSGGYIEHRGIDLVGREGDTVNSMWKGKVTKIAKSKKNGLTITIRHDKDLYTVYGHLKNLSVKVGQSVNQYQPIGKITKSPEYDKPVLHLEVMVDGNQVNPVFFFGKRGYQSLENYIMRTDNMLSDAMKELLPRLRKNYLADKSKPLVSNSFDAKDEVIYDRDDLKWKKGTVRVYIGDGYKAPQPKGDFK